MTNLQESGQNSQGPIKFTARSFLGQTEKHHVRRIAVIQYKIHDLYFKNHKPRQLPQDQPAGL
jgi:hypothetical protein